MLIGVLRNTLPASLVPVSVIRKRVPLSLALPLKVSPVEVKPLPKLIPVAPGSIVYVALATALEVYPVAVAIAFRVAVELIVTLLHAGELGVGVEPSVVQ